MYLDQKSFQTQPLYTLSLDAGALPEESVD